MEVMNAFDKFPLVSGLKPDEAKCKIAGIGVLKEVSLALCGMDCIDLTKKTIKILGIHFSHNKKLETEENFISHVRKIEKVLKLLEIWLWKEELIFSKLYQDLKSFTFP